MKKFCRFYQLKKVGSNALGGVFYSVTRDQEKQLRDYMLVEIREEYRRPRVWESLNEFFHFSRKLNHPNVLTYELWGKCRDGYYAATHCREFFSLTSVLAQIKKKNLPFSFDIPIQAIFQLATGLQYLANVQYKGAPILHNLITPDDIMVSLDGVVYIANFGVYQAIYSTDRELANDLATERSAFLAPELISKKKPSPQADVYSVAALLYFLLTGKLISQNKDLEQQLNEVKMLAKWEGGDKIPEGLKSILKKALSPAEQRYRNIGEFVGDLEKFVEEEDITPTTFNLAYYMNTLFQEEKEERERLVKESRDKVPVEIIEEPEEGEKPVVVEEEKKGFPVVLVSVVLAVIAIVVVGILLLRKPAQKTINPQELEKKINQLVEQKLKQKEEELRKQYEEKYGQLNAQKQEELKKALEEERKKLLAMIRKQQMAKMAQATPQKVPAPSPQPSRSQSAPSSQQARTEKPAPVQQETETAKTQTPPPQQAPPEKKTEEAKPPVPAKPETETKPAVIPGSVVPLNELDSPVKLIRRVAPRMPIKALRLRVRGSVMASILIDENGNVARVRIIRATPKGFFEEEAYRTLLKWKFTPPRKKGVPVKVWKVVTIQFK